ncbi:hypothetical protein D9757_008953 [Collybiopsis confluens]|uniref:Beta-lactamase-related domain-containing protein n=1 Tax=Collybiopsis confluens TaxID=2823264 RepID=A0A8H5HFA3_9AGAR|nr:hypothetical protein D9757_008953 [Collybiopsis confluens]
MSPFDSSFNLYAFGFNGNDYNAGTSDSWASGTPTEVTASGRPSPPQENTLIRTLQFYNAIYVVNGDNSNPNNVHVFDPSKKSWSTQATSGGPSDFNAILDHDTNVFYALSDAGELSFLSFENITTSAQSGTIGWTDVGKAGIDTTDYKPVMAIANNHIHFLDVPGVAAGSADIFVIHFSFWQPTPQPYGNFPAQHGQTASIFQSTSNGQVQQAFAFIPDDGSATYIIDVISNTTTSLAGPSTKDASASYFASNSAIVQLTSSGSVSWIPYTNSPSDSSASWSTVKNLVSVAPTSSAGSGSGSATGTKSASGSSSTGGGSGSGSSSGSASGSSSGSASGSSNASIRASAKAVFGVMVAMVLGSVATGEKHRSKKLLIVSGGSRALGFACFIDDILHEWRSPGGVSVALVQRDAASGTWTIETEGYGIAKADGTTVNENTQFAIASNSKLFTAIATGILLSDETMSPRLSWKSKISQILPGDWKLQDPIASSETTLIDMLSHRTGIPRHEHVYSLDDTLASLLHKIQFLRPSAEFRETRQYNNLMYMIASYLPETMHRKPFPQFVKDKIFDPLGMNSTSYATTDSALADGFKKDVGAKDDDVFGGIPRAMPYATPSNGETNHIGMGPGGVITTATDMAIWLQTLLLEGKHPRTGNQIIPQEVVRKVSSSVTAVTSPIQYPEFSPSVYGAGLYTKSYRGHCDNPGFTAVISRFPKDNLGIAVLTNDGDMGAYIMEIIKYHLVDRVLGLEAIDWNKRFKEEVVSTFNSGKEHLKAILKSQHRLPPSVPLSELAEGTYINPAYGTLKFALATSRVEELPNLKEADMPCLWTRWDRIWATHLVLAHLEGNKFRVLLPRSLPLDDPSKPYWMNYEIKGNDLSAEFVINDSGAEVLGFALNGNFWGASGVEEPQGEGIKGRAEVWFDRR